MHRPTALLALLAASALLVAGPVEAARGGKGNGGSKTSSMTLDQSDPRHGDTITFTVSTTETDRPFSKVVCSRNGTIVYTSSAGHFDDYYLYFGAPEHHLASLNWPSGAADCTGSLVYQARNGRTKTLASVSFRVDA
jgi:hypothetical protein